MATRLFLTATSRGFPCTHACPNYSLPHFLLSFPISCRRSSSSLFRLYPPSLPSRTASLLRRASASSPPPQPDSDPPSQEDSVRLTGLVATLSRFQDSIQIFLAVLFWVSLFFWATAWDGRNSDRPNKGPRLRR